MSLPLHISVRKQESSHRSCVWVSSSELTAEVTPARGISQSQTGPQERKVVKLFPSLQPPKEGGWLLFTLQKAASVAHFLLSWLQGSAIALGLSWIWKCWFSVLGSRCFTRNIAEHQAGSSWLINLSIPLQCSHLGAWTCPLQAALLHHRVWKGGRCCRVGVLSRTGDQRTQVCLCKKCSMASRLPAGWRISISLERIQSSWAGIKRTK